MKIDVKFVENFEKVQSQLSSLHDEVSALSKKTPDAPLNEFKVKFVNLVLEKCNIILDGNKPFEDFDKFDTENLPTASDIVMMLGQYSSCMEELRADNITQDGTTSWSWVFSNGKDGSKTYPPKKLNK
jgi:hypothetical protein